MNDTELETWVDQQFGDAQNYQGVTTSDVRVNMLDSVRYHLLKRGIVERIKQAYTNGKIEGRKEALDLMEKSGWSPQ